MGYIVAEHHEQAALFSWARTSVVLRNYPELKLLEGSMNGVKLSIGQAGKAKACGMLKGSPDITLPVARGGHIGLKIELKYGRNGATAEQLDILKELGNAGHKTLVCWGWPAAREEIESYLAMPETDVIFKNDLV